MKSLPAAWEAVARAVWPDETVERAELRRRWDIHLARLRARWRAASIRADLIHADGVGNVGLLLNDGDRVEDRS